MFAPVHQRPAQPQNPPPSAACSVVSHGSLPGALCYEGKLSWDPAMVPGPQQEPLAAGCRPSCRHLSWLGSTDKALRDHRPQRSSESKPEQPYCWVLQCGPGGPRSTCKPRGRGPLPTGGQPQHCHHRALVTGAFQCTLIEALAAEYFTDITIACGTNGSHVSRGAPSWGQQDTGVPNRILLGCRSFSGQRGCDKKDTCLDQTQAESCNDQCQADAQVALE